jgi:hypothetical protein
MHEHSRPMCVARSVWQEACGKKCVARSVWQDACGQKWGKKRVARSMWQEACGKKRVARRVWQEACGKTRVARSVWQDACGKTRVARSVWPEVGQDMHMYMPHARARLLNLHAALCDLLHHHALARERLAKRSAVVRTRAREIEAPLGHADQAHAMVDAPRPEPCL